MSRWLTQPWLFEGLRSLAPARRRHWAELCYVPSPADDQMRDTQRSIVAVYHPGAGLSTSLDLLSQFNILTIGYPPEQWPGEAGEFTTARDHFSQWMALVARQIRDLVEETPALAARLDVPHHEFLVWLIRRYLSKRQGDNWLRRLQELLPVEQVEAVKANLETNDLDQSYGQTTQAIEGQIDECSALVRRLGYQGISITIDISWSDWVYRNAAQRLALVAQVRRLLSVLPPLQRRHFGIKVGIPTALDITASEIEQLSRSRVTVASYRWDDAKLATIVRRLVSAGSDDQHSGEPWTEPQVWAQLREELSKIWSHPGPAAAVALARCILEEEPAAQVGEAQIGAVRRHLYAQFAPVQLDGDHTRRIVWRGRQPIYLDEAQFRCFELLWRQRGFHVNPAMLVRHSSRTQVNLDKIISRLRERLEPFYTTDKKRWLYIQRTAGQGVWLERFTGTGDGADYAPPAA